MEAGQDTVPEMVTEGHRDSAKELDLLPEYCHYRDDGCEIAVSCLNCPFPKCIYEEPGGKQRLMKRLRDGEVFRLFLTKGKGVKELSVMFGISQRTVQRILKRMRNERSFYSGADKPS